MVAFFILPGLCSKLKLADAAMPSGRVRLVVGPMRMLGLMPPLEWSCLQNQNAHSMMVYSSFFILHTSCQFLLVAEVSTTISEGPKNRYERLENRISSSCYLFPCSHLILKPDELEMLLKQKENDSGRSHSPSNSHLAGLLLIHLFLPPLMIMWTHRNTFIPPFALWSYQWI